MNSYSFRVAGGYTQKNIINIILYDIQMIYEIKAYNLLKLKLKSIYTARPMPAMAPTQLFDKAASALSHCAYLFITYFGSLSCCFWSLGITLSANEMAARQICLYMQYDSNQQYRTHLAAF